MYRGVVFSSFIVNYSLIKIVTILENQENKLQKQAKKNGSFRGLRREGGGKKYSKKARDLSRQALIQKYMPIAVFALILIVVLMIRRWLNAFYYSSA